MLDDDLGSLLLTHDALGVVELFYAERPREFLFGCSLENLVAVTGVGKLDEDYIAEMLAGVEDHDDRTPYRHIRRVGQGRSLIVQDGVARSMRTYDPSAVRPLRLRGSGEYEERFRSLAIEAVSTALPPSGKVWCELSGGLDSSSLVSIAAGTLQAKFETFSVVFRRSSRADETDWIETVLRSYPSPSHRLDGDGAPPFSSMPERFQPEPTGASLICGFDEARRALFQTHNVDVVLTGMCGDAVFIGDSPEPYYLADMVNPARIIGELRRWRRESHNGRSLGYWLQQYVLWPRLDRILSRPLPTSPPPPWIGDGYSERWHAAGRNRRRIRGLSVGDEYFWGRLLQGALLAGGGQKILPGRCNFRNPWLYLPLVEFMAATPWSEKLHPGLDRTLQRRALRGILPEPTRMRRGKRTPSQAFFAGLGESDHWARLLTNRPAIVERGYVDGGRWRDAVTLAQHGYCKSTAGFMRACMLEAWFATLDRAPHANGAQVGGREAHASTSLA